MSWNYRIVKYADGSGFGLHEVYYTGKKETGMTTLPCNFTCDSHADVKDIISSLKLALKDAAERPIFEEPEGWSLPK